MGRLEKNGDAILTCAGTSRPAGLHGIQHRLAGYWNIHIYSLTLGKHQPPYGTFWTSVCYLVATNPSKQQWHGLGLRGPETVFGSSITALTTVTPSLRPSPPAQKSPHAGQTLPAPILTFWQHQSSTTCAGAKVP